MSSKNKQIKKIVNLVLKIVISSGSIAYLGYLLGIQKVGLFEQINSYFSNKSIAVFPLILVFVLMFVNWGAEIFKWRLLSNYMMPVSFKLAAKSTLAGVAASVFTPFRVGSFFGKAALFPHRMRGKGMILQLFNAMAMFIVNFFFGLLFIGFLGLFADGFIFGVNSKILSAIGFLGSVLVLIFWFLFVNVRILLTAFGRWKFTKSWSKYFELVNDSRYTRLSITLIFVSVLRYLAITYQYVLVYEVFGVGIEGWQTFVAAGTLFFILQFLPVFNAVELGVTRTAILSLILTTFGLVTELTPQITLSITLASFFIWVVNLAIPAVIGSVFLSQVKVLKEC
ncbi:MAG: hypothetical protein CMP61_11445 [Flavobacteriales bacterium]|nr:hypothetical protein [Flavobacteriales bacterium]